MSCSEYLNRKTLIAGDVNSGKTHQTLSILRHFLNCEQSPLGVLDLAPEKVRTVGGKIPLTPEEKGKILYLSPVILPPRLLGKNEGEVQALAKENRERIDAALEIVRNSKLCVLVVNDVSLYFHDGEAQFLLSSVEHVPTLLINGYYGKYFGESPLSRKERVEMEYLMARCDRVYVLPSHIS